jgi:hypothetical protein
MEHNIYIKLSFFNIKKKYLQSLTQSNLIYYHKLKNIFKINKDIVLIDVENWLANCVRKMEKNY